MKKDRNFLVKLENELIKNNVREKDIIVSKYEKIINDKLNNGNKITSILKEFGSPIEVAKKEIKELKSKDNFFINIYNSFNNFINKIKTKENYDFNTKKNIEKIYVEKPLTDDQIKRKKTIKTLGTISLVLLIFLWIWTNILTMASFIAILDGVKIYGIFIILLGINLLVLWFNLIVINIMYKKLNLLKIKLISLYSIVFLISLGLVLSIVEIVRLDKVSNISDKYNMVTKKDTYNMVSGDDKKTYIIFNSEYDTQYMINYDNTLDGTFKVEVNYYEEYYDYYVKNYSNNIYISLRKDNRDILSTYINEIKENKIYSKEELSRYTVKITISKKDYQRLVIED